MRIDRQDARILALIQTDRRLTTEQIGVEVGLSHTGVVRRLKRLRENAVITGAVALVSARAVGLSVRVNVSCSIDRDRPDTYDRFVEALRAEPAVISADSITGEADFAFTIVARSMDHFRDILRHFTDAFPSIRSVTSLVVLEQLKRGPIPVEPNV